MKFTFSNSIIVITLISLPFISAQTSNNLSCYQCDRTTNTVCEADELRPCPPVSDRCVTHISKNAEDGFSIKRECGLGPCGFDDDMVNIGLGFDKCDRSRSQYFCIFCCKDSGCNNSESAHVTYSVTLLLTTLPFSLYCNKFFA